MAMIADDFMSLVWESLEDELADIRDWSYLAEIAPTAEIRQIITTMVGDEYGHARVWATILSVDPTNPIYQRAHASATEEFCSGVYDAILGELAAVSRYAEMARIAPSEQLRLIVMNIMGDEYQHQKIWATIYQIYCR